RQPEPALPRDHEGAQRARLRPAGHARRGSAARARLVLGEPRGRGPLMRISIVGTGYVGLVTGACLAEKGHRVLCVDVDAKRVAALNRAEAPIFEAGLPELLARHVGTCLSATTDLAAAVRESEVTLIAVGTPFDG